MPYRYPIQFGKYLLVQRIAVGGMAEVFKAKLIGPRGFEKTLAVKKILPEFSQDDDFVQMFVDEARISSHLHHSNIVQVYDFGEVSGSYYITMEYMDGPNLKTLFQKCLKSKGQFPRTLALYVALEIARALDYAHNVSLEGEQILNLVHRDISPQNVLIGRRGEVKITDFGIAKANIKLTKTQPGKVQGKLSYMSPEQATGRSIDRRSDIFSLGIILYELLTGVKVYAGGNTGEKYLKIRNAEIPPIQTLVPDLEGPVINLITSMVAKEPQDRPASAAIIAQTLSEILSYVAREEIQTQMREIIAMHFPPERSDSSVGRRIQEIIDKGAIIPESETLVRTGILSSISGDASEAQTDPTIGSKLEKTKPIRASSKKEKLLKLGAALVSGTLGVLALGIGFFYARQSNTVVIPPKKIERKLPPLDPEPVTAQPSAQDTISPNNLSGPVDVDMQEEAMIRQMEMEEKIKDLETQVKDAERKASEKAIEAKLAAEKLTESKKAASKPKPPCPSDMVLIPAGDFYFGSSSTDPDRNELVEVAQKKENFSRGYCVDKYEFPNKFGAKPARQKSWTEALGECKSVSKRLCTQEEWERSCRGSKENPNPMRVYSYGNTWQANACAVLENEEEKEEGNHLLANMGSHSRCKSPDGVYDLLGNVEEWTQSQGVYGVGNRVVKGGSLTGSKYLARCSSRREIAADTRREELGFRCCKDAAN